MITKEQQQWIDDLKPFDPSGEARAKLTKLYTELNKYPKTDWGDPDVIENAQAAVDNT